MENGFQFFPLISVDFAATKKTKLLLSTRYTVILENFDVVFQANRSFGYLTPI